jgi:hypothetical protein
MFGRRAIPAGYRAGRRQILHAQVCLLAGAARDGGDENIAQAQIIRTVYGTGWLAKPLMQGGVQEIT